LNYRLQEEAVDAQVNKSFIEQWLMRLWTIVSPRPQCFWLFLARINELALLCASRYVDCCEFSAAHEFLVEPNCVLLQVKEGRTLVSQDGGGRAGTLLRCLYDLLKRSGYLTEDYLLSISRRAEKIAQTAEAEQGHIIQAALKEAQAEDERFIARVPDLHRGYIAKAQERAEQTVAELKRRYDERHVQLRNMAEEREGEALAAAFQVLISPEL